MEKCRHHLQLANGVLNELLRHSISVSSKKKKKKHLISDAGANRMEAKHHSGIRHQLAAVALSPAHRPRERPPRNDRRVGVET